MSNLKVLSLNLWKVYEFKWGTAIKENRTGKWNSAFLKPDAQEINLEHLNVEVHENGIEFL